MVEIHMGSAISNPNYILIEKVVKHINEEEKRDKKPLGLFKFFGTGHLIMSSIFLGSADTPFPDIKCPSIQFFLDQRTIFSCWQTTC
jgi:hypothetical protein